MQTAGKTDSEVLTMFSDPGNFRARLSFIAQHLDMIMHPRPESSSLDPAAVLGVLQDLAKSAAVPPGGEKAQETLLCALGCYREALDGLHLARLDNGLSGHQAAKDRVREGDVLLSIAMKLVDVG